MSVKNNREKKNSGTKKEVSEKRDKTLRKRKGIVVSAHNDKTIVVAVQSFKTHPKYIKKYKSTKKYHVHDEKNVFQKGDEVEFIPSRPFSRNKRFQVLYNK